MGLEIRPAREEEMSARARVPAKFTLCAFVDGELVTEALLMATIVDK